MKIVGTIATTLFFLAFLALALLLLGSMMPIANYQIRIVESGSMSPTIPLGSAVVITPHESYGIDDVVTFQRIGDDEVTTHRIIGEEVVDGERLLTMQGDANNAVDQKPVREREIMGKVVWHFPYLGFLIDFIRKPVGFALVIGIPALWIVYEQVLRVVREVKKQKEAPDTTQA